MATGDSPDFLRRLRSLIPSGWVQDFTIYDALQRPIAPVANAVLGGISDALAWIYAQGQIIRAQTRRLGTTGWLLDVDAWGFLGSRVVRRPGESDAAWSARYRAEVFRPKVTRPAIIQALTDLTGRAPTVLEPWNAGDCGAYDGCGLAYAGSDFVPSSATGYDLGGALDTGSTGYDVQVGASGNTSPGMGCWGSLEIPYQLFVTAYRPLGGGVPNASGTDTGVQGYDIGAFRYIDQSDVTSPVSDAEIYATVANTEAAGVVAWTAISD